MSATDAKIDRNVEFQQALERLLNAHSRENASNTPDFILAGYLAGCLRVWDEMVTRREEWYGRPLPTVNGGSGPVPVDRLDAFPEPVREHVVALEEENARLLPDAIQAHARNDELVAEHLKLKAQIKELEEALVHARTPPTRVR